MSPTTRDEWPYRFFVQTLDDGTVMIDDLDTGETVQIEPHAAPKFDPYDEAQVERVFEARKVIQSVRCADADSSEDVESNERTRVTPP